MASGSRFGKPTAAPVAVDPEPARYRRTPRAPAGAAVVGALGGWRSRNRCRACRNRPGGSRRSWFRGRGKTHAAGRTGPLASPRVAALFSAAYLRNLRRRATRCGAPRRRAGTCRCRAGYSRGAAVARDIENRAAPRARLGCAEAVRACLFSARAPGTDAIESWVLVPSVFPLEARRMDKISHCCVHLPSCVSEPSVRSALL